MKFSEKIIAAFKIKFPGINLSKTRLAAIAAKIEAKVIDDETKIDAELDAMNGYVSFADMAKEDDRVRTLESKLKPVPKNETPEEKLAREQKEALETKVDDPDMPAWAKQIIASNQTLTNELRTIKAKEALGTIKGKLQAELLKDIPVSYWGKRAIPEKEEDVQAFVDDVTNDYTTFKQEMSDKGLAILSEPPGGGAGGGGSTVKTKEATKDEVAAVVDNIM